MKNETIQTPTRNVGLDLIRVLACYMVIQVHTGEFFYIAPTGSILHGDGNIWVALFNSLCRSSVPLFVMMSGFFLLPIKDDQSVFFKRKFTRVLFPFVIWCMLYAIYKFLMGQTGFNAMLVNIAHIPVNFGVEIGHLWYVYMLIGIYLLAPVVSPWLKTASKRHIEFYLLIWLVTNLLPYIHLIYPEIWGECYWNSTPMLYYFSGFIGYAILGFYIKKFYLEKNKYDFIVGLFLVILGYAITAYGFYSRLNTVKTVAELELTWGFNTINVVMITAGIFLLLKNVTYTNTHAWYARIIEDIAIKSYGIYLAHIILLNTVYGLLNVHITNYMLKIPVMAFTTFICTYAVIRLLSYLPKSKYLIG